MARKSSRRINGSRKRRVVDRKTHNRRNTYANCNNGWKISKRPTQSSTYIDVSKAGIDATMVILKRTGQGAHWLKVLSELNGIPGIPIVHDSWICGNDTYIVMEKIYNCGIPNIEELTNTLNAMKARNWLYVSGGVKCGANKHILLINFNNAVKKHSGTYPNHHESRKYERSLNYADLEIMQDLNMQAKFFSKNTRIDADQLQRGIQRNLFKLSKLRKSKKKYKPIISKSIQKRHKSVIENCIINEEWIQKNFLGSGLSGKVYAACTRNNPTDCEYALKTQYADEMYYNEVEALQDLQGVRGIPILYNAWTCNGIGYMVLERLYPIQYLTRKEGRIIERITNDMLNKNWLYIDLHSDNVMLNKNGNIVLTDFGWAVKKRKGTYPDHPLSKAYRTPLSFDELVEAASPFSLTLH